MCKICKNKSLSGLEKISCNCSNVKNIPYIFGLRKLTLKNCSLITEIPPIEGLQEITIRNCPLITSIPHIIGLKKIYCYNCPLLMSIPRIDGLKILYLNNCNITQIPYIKNVNFSFKKCGFLEKNKECNICMENPAFITTLCNHTFCAKCINTWTKSGNNTCPNCRQNIIPDIIHTEPESIENFNIYSNFMPINFFQIPVDVRYNQVFFR